MCVCALPPFCCLPFARKCCQIEFYWRDSMLCHAQHTWFPSCAFRFYGVVLVLVFLHFAFHLTQLHLRFRWNFWVASQHFWVPWSNGVLQRAWRIIYHALDVTFLQFVRYCLGNSKHGRLRMPLQFNAIKPTKSQRWRREGNQYYLQQSRTYLPHLRWQLQ